MGAKKEAAHPDGQHDTQSHNTTRITRSQRFTRRNPCPICGGHDQSGKGSRCWGFLSGDGRFIHCTRSEYAGNLSQGRDGTFSHILNGSCRCGEFHYGEIRSAPSQEKSHDDRQRLINWLDGLANESRPIAPGDPVDRYLRNRGIALKSYPEDLRTHPRLAYKEDGAILGYSPAMLAVVRNPEGRPVGFHRTWLTTDGQKATVSTPKKTTPLIGMANAIQLSLPGDVLAIAEGIETTLSFGILTGLPVWSCISSGGIERFSPPGGVKKIVIAGDHDKAGIESAQRLMDRMRIFDIEVAAIFPDDIEQDWNDTLREVVHG